MKKLLPFVMFLMLMILINCKYYEIEYDTLDNEINDSLIGLTIDNTPTTSFPTKERGLAIDSIICDKGANGVWDYKNWLLKVRNVTENRTKCQVNFVTKYTESILNGADPVLKEGLIPVMISDEGVVTKASEGWEWYKYESKHEWANAVILNDETKEYYDGDIIPENEIESYFVWIPRYKYKLFNEDNGNYEELIDISNLTSKAQLIEIKFGVETTSDTSDSCATPMKSGESGTCSAGKYMTHPAFTSFDEEGKITKGIWVGKFETGYKGATSTEEAQVNIIENGFDKIQIKPNVYSWRSIQVVNAYFTSYNYKREYDSHMMKNTEWGAVAYLQHSDYGSGNVNVRINNNEAYITGYAAKSEPNCGYIDDNLDCNKYESTEKGKDGTYTVNYFNPSSVVASTTNNYSGVYDMSGGSWEYVMGVMVDKNTGKPCSGRNVTYNSGFNGQYCGVGEKESLTTGINFPENKRYYDTYVYGDTKEKYNRRILGDATGEMGPFQIKSYAINQQSQISSWYNNTALFIYIESPWFRRGSRFPDGSDAGMFTFSLEHGSARPLLSFRIVLSF